MGLTNASIQLILNAKLAGVDFSRVAMLGRQTLNLTPSELHALFQMYNMELSLSAAQAMLQEDERYAEPLFRHLGAEVVESFDASDFERATYIEDLNKPLPARYHKKYTLVVDGGTLEHVFNFPVAIKSAMELLDVRGHYITITPGNNFLGHGFYQFSPELFFSVFTPSNGFQILNVLAVPRWPLNVWYIVSDPSKIKTRVILANREEVELFVIAERISDVEPLTSPPQQSDYVNAWDKPEVNPRIPPPSKQLIRRIVGKMPLPVRMWLRQVSLGIGIGVFRPLFFTPVRSKNGQFILYPAWKRDRRAIHV